MKFVFEVSYHIFHILFYWVTNFLQLIKGKSAWSFEAPWDRRRWRHRSAPHLLLQGQLRILACWLLCQRGVRYTWNEWVTSTTPRHHPLDSSHLGWKTASDQVPHRLGWHANPRIDHGREREPKCCGLEYWRTNAEGIVVPGQARFDEPRQFGRSSSELLRRYNHVTGKVSLKICFHVMKHCEKSNLSG